MADFRKIEHDGSVGNIGSDVLEVNLVTVDDKPPRLHIGRWTPDGRHKRFSGFITEDQAADLWGVLDKLNPDK